MRGRGLASGHALHLATPAREREQWRVCLCARPPQACGDGEWTGLERERRAGQLGGECAESTVERESRGRVWRGGGGYSRLHALKKLADEAKH
eukprot:179033-Chlamydomonas_euryale.AAC.1